MLTHANPDIRWGDVNRPVISLWVAFTETREQHPDPRLLLNGDFIQKLNHTLIGIARNCTSRKLSLILKPLL
ncbi:hypothetical protein D3C72_1931490 [compost metagenome]